MMTIELAIKLIGLLPPLQFGTPTAPVPAPEGNGILLITGCQPYQHLMVMPGNISGSAGEDGIARVTAPAQASDADTYRIATERGESKVNGTLNAGETLSASCQ